MFPNCCNEWCLLHNCSFLTSNKPSNVRVSLNFPYTDPTYENIQSLQKLSLISSPLQACAFEKLCYGSLYFVISSSRNSYWLVLPM